MMLQGNEIAKMQKLTIVIAQIYRVIFVATKTEVQPTGWVPAALHMLTHLNFLQAL